LAEWQLGRLPVPELDDAVILTQVGAHRLACRLGVEEPVVPRQLVLAPKAVWVLIALVAPQAVVAAVVLARYDVIGVWDHHHSGAFCLSGAVTDRFIARGGLRFFFSYG
jgi:hypothetical protein